MKIGDFIGYNQKSLDLQNKIKSQSGKDKSIIKDEFEKSVKGEENNYNALKSNLNEEVMQRVLADTEKATNLIYDLTSGMLKRQLDVPENEELSMEALLNKFIDKLNSEGAENFQIDKITQEEAQKLIDEGGEWSPEKVSQRIVDFSIAAFGGDKSKIDIIKDAISRGFGEAQKVWGSELPDITNETRDLIDKKLDDWINGENAEEAENSKKSE